MSKRRYMIDIEGLGAMPGGVILSIGWCRFDPEQGAHWDAAGEVRLEIQPQLDAGLRVDGSTLDFWLRQTALPWAPGTIEQPPRAALLRFCHEIRKADEVWAKPPTYDLTGIRAACAALDVPVSWHFRTERCFRTLCQTAPSGLRMKPLAEGLKHGAVVDAVHQAREAAVMLKAMSQ